MAQLKISDLSVGDWVGIDQAELNMPSDDLATACIEKLRKPIRIKGISEDSDMVIADIEIVDEWGVYNDEMRASASYPHHARDIKEEWV